MRYKVNIDNNLEKIHDKDYERSLLSQMIFDPKIIKKIISSKLPLFYEGKHQIILKALDYFDTEGKEVNQITLIEHLRKEKDLEKIGGEEAIAGICDESSSSALHEDYIKILKDLALKREVIRIVKTASNNLKDSYNGVDIIEYLQTEIIEINKLITEKKLNIAEKVRKWVLLQDGNFFVTDCYKDLNLVTISYKTSCRVALKRLVDEGIIEKYGDRRGSYRLVNVDLEKMDWRHAMDETIDIKYPFEIEQYVETMPGNIIVIAGEQNAGKTAFLLNFIKLNMHKHDVQYFNSEMGGSELRKRILKFDYNVNDWKFQAWERSDNFHDVIKPDAINVIDFLEVYDEFYKIGGYFKQIYDKLNKGIAIIAIQKNKGTDAGVGGARTLEKPRLYLAIESGKIKIVKAKNWRTNVNPKGLEIDFKLVKGCQFKSNDSEWHHPTK